MIAGIGIVLKGTSDNKNTALSRFCIVKLVISYQGIVKLFGNMEMVHLL
jgi:hypothetical protein